MYCEFFGFTERPFEITPDPKFLYLNPAYREMLASLLYGIRERRGFVTLIGDVGVGKTTLLNAVQDRLDEKTKVVSIFNTGISFEQMLNYALTELGISSDQESLSKADAFRRLKEFALQEHSRGGNLAFIVDEAQNLDNDALEDIRLLSNIETHKQKLIQIVLSGQPELEAKLAQAELKQLAQRISLRHYIKPLSEKETLEYVDDRLVMANYKGPSLFDRQSRKLIWEFSGGVPRRINILCDNALAAAFGVKRKKIKAALMRKVIQGLSGPVAVPPPEEHSPNDAPVFSAKPVKPGRAGMRLGLWAGLGLTGCLILAVAFYSGEFSLNSQEMPDEAVPMSFRGKITPPSKPLLAGAKEPVPAEKPAGENLPPGTEEQGFLMAATVPTEIIKNPVPPAATLTPERKAEDKEPQSRVKWELLSQKGTENGKERPVRYLVVKKGDTLYKIIADVYGTYDKEKMKKVMRENPDLPGPDKIMAGQVIRLPHLGAAGKQNPGTANTPQRQAHLKER
jgi:general secretion pathway protein A